MTFHLVFVHDFTPYHHAGKQPLAALEPGEDYGRGTGTMPANEKFNLIISTGMTVKELKEQLMYIPDDAELQ